MQQNNLFEFNYGWMLNELPKHERPLERAMQVGEGALSDIELLTAVCGFKSMNPAKTIMKLCRDNLANMTTVREDELLAIPGVTRNTLAKIRIARELNKRYKYDHSERLESPEAIAEYMYDIFEGQEQEHFYIVLLNTKHSVIKKHLCTIGLLDRSQVHAREVYREAILHNAKQIVCVHNHPSGDCTPSAQDISCTRNLQAAGKIIGIELLDHVIIVNKESDGRRYYMSLREEGLI